MIWVLAKSTKDVILGFKAHLGKLCRFPELLLEHILDRLDIMIRGLLNLHSLKKLEEKLVGICMHRK